MPAAIICAGFGLLLLVGVTAAAYRMGGTKIAIITAIGSLLAFTTFAVLALMLIVNSMPN
ncbi:MAG: hypothetical protein GWN30_04565 [Gammaproteobacteria bacterium]|nr:hypothetical protein [Gammaproteobacteria bacterium]